MAKQILVTGAGGFTGGALANELALRGHRVRALVRRDTGWSLLDPELIGEGRIELFRGDLRDAEEVDRAVAGTETVYHIAALYRSARAREKDFWESNVEGTQQVIDAARRHGVARLLHCSTIGVHGGVSEIPSDETAPFAPGDVYQRTKLEGEQRAQHAIRSGQPITVVRPAGIYGPGDLRFLKLFSLVQSGCFVLFGSGKTSIHLVFIDDLVEGMIQAAESGGAVGKTMILAGERHTSIQELVEVVAKSLEVAPPRLRVPLWPLEGISALCEWVCRPLGVEPPLHRRRAAFFSKNRAFSIDRARRDIGYAPRVDLAEGARRSVCWYREQGLLRPPRRRAIR
jgi:nucleoside-diphosphate-sugar epimerase